MTPEDDPAGSKVPLNSLRHGDVIVGPFGRYELAVLCVDGVHVEGRYTVVPPNGYEVGAFCRYLRRDWPDGMATLARPAAGEGDAK